MNMQALMKQAQAMQNDIKKIQNEIANSSFEGISSFVKVVVNGKKEVVSINFNDNYSDIVNDKEMLEDMVLLAVNDAMNKVDKTTEQKMGKYSNLMSGLM